MNCLLHGEALNKSNLLACVVEQTLARNTTENNARRNQRKYLFRLFFSNRPAVRGLQSLLFHRNYLSRKITNNNEVHLFQMISIERTLKENFTIRFRCLMDQTVKNTNYF